MAVLARFTVMLVEQVQLIGILEAFAARAVEAATQFVIHLLKPITILYRSVPIAADRIDHLEQLINELMTTVQVIGLPSFVSCILRHIELNALADKKFISAKERF